MYKRQDDWCLPVGRADRAEFWKWETAIRAEENGSVKATFFEPGVEREVELGFVKPPKLVAYTAPPVRVTQELPAKTITEPKPGRPVPAPPVAQPSAPPKTKAAP